MSVKSFLVGKQERKEATRQEAAVTGPVFAVLMNHWQLGRAQWEQLITPSVLRGLENEATEDISSSPQLGTGDKVESHVEYWILGKSSLNQNS